MIRIALINAHGTKCLADHDIKPLLFQDFLLSLLQMVEGGKKRISVTFFVPFHGAFMVFIIDTQSTFAC